MNRAKKMDINRSDFVASPMQVLEQHQKRMKNNLLMLSFLMLANLCFAQRSVRTVDEILDQVLAVNKGVDEVIELDVSGLTLFELLTSIAEEHRLNISADPEMNQLVVSNFFDVKVRDVFHFLIQKYELDIAFQNNILIFKKKKKKEIAKIIPKKEIAVSYNAQNEFLSAKLKNDSLPSVAEKITEVSGRNVVLAPDVKAMKVSAYILNRPFDQVLSMIAKSNQLVMSKDDNGFYFLEKDTELEEEDKSRAGGKRRTTSKSGRSRKATSGDLEMALNSNGYLSIKAQDADATSLLLQAAELLNVSYFMYDRPDQIKATLSSEAIDFDRLLQHIFRGKSFTAKKTDDFYLIGKETSEGLRVTELIQLENRTIETVLNTLPKSLTQGVELQEFVELNGILASGSKPIIAELKEVIRKLDKVVPLVQIEVLIVQYQKSYEIQTGMQALLDPENGADVQTSGTLFPNSDMTLNSGAVNELIDAFNGLGIINIGKVTKNFYASLSALENNSLISLKSTPKIATLSGHQASISIGETNYYFEQTNRLINSGVNNNILQSGQWRPTEANLSVSIKPFVSKDEHVTLEIAVEKSAFLGRAGENAPPGKSTQRFESLIRVKNSEMILLGGLDELEKENSGTGTPILSRIPIIKWFFSGRTKGKEKSKLHIFIKPSIVY